MTCRGPTAQKGSPNAHNYCRNRPTHTREGIILETLPNFHNRARLLIQTVSEDRFCCFVLENCLECKGILNEVDLFLPQRTNIAREQTVVACGESLILRMP